MSFSSIKPFLVEMITFLFVVITVFIGLLVCNLVEIIIHPHLLTITAFGLLLIIFISLFSKIVPIGIRAIFDFLFQNVREDTYVFIRTQPYRASVFTEKSTANYGRSYGMYYLVQVKKENQIYTFISAGYVDLVEGESYLIKSGQSSSIYLNSKLVV